MTESQDFQIQNLLKQLEEKNEEIKQLNERLRQTYYFVVLSEDLLKKSHNKIKEAIDGEAAKPMLRMDYQE